MGGAKRRQEALDGPGIERQFAVREVECGRVGLGRAAGARDGSDRAVERVAGLGQERLAGAGEPDPAGESLEQRDPQLRLEIMDLLGEGDRKSTRLNSSHVSISYAVFCLKKKNKSC